MSTVEINSTPREGTGKGANRQLRMAGKMPAVIYGHGVEKSINVSLEPRDLDKALAEPTGVNTLITLKIEGGDTFHVFPREIQRHPVSRRIQHVDFVAPDLEKPVVAVVPVITTGKSIGVAMGGKLRTPWRDVKVRALPGQIPVELTVDITDLDVGDEFMVSQLPRPEGVEVLFDRDFAVARVVAARGAKKSKDEEETE